MSRVVDSRPRAPDDDPISSFAPSARRDSGRSSRPGTRPHDHRPRHHRQRHGDPRRRRHRHDRADDRIDRGQDRFIGRLQARDPRREGDRRIPALHRRARATSISTARDDQEPGFDGRRRRQARRGRHEPRGRPGARDASASSSIARRRQRTGDSRGRTQPSRGRRGQRVAAGAAGQLRRDGHADPGPRRHQQRHFGVRDGRRREHDDAQRNVVRRVVSSARRADDDDVSHVAVGSDARRIRRRADVGHRRVGRQRLDAAGAGHARCAGAAGGRSDRRALRPEVHEPPTRQRGNRRVFARQVFLQLRIPGVAPDGRRAVACSRSTPTRCSTPASLPTRRSASHRSSARNAYP